MAIGDHYVLTLKGQWQSPATQISNVFAYKQISATGNNERLFEAFVSDVLPAILDVLSEATIFTAIDVVNMETLADFGTYGLTAQEGVDTGDSMPPFVTWEFEYLRTTRAINNGRKAIGIMAESRVLNGEATADIQPFLEALAVAFETNLTNSIDTSIYSPQLWRRPGTYSSGAVAAPGVFWDIAGVEYRRVSTQNTRKFGRGI